MDCKFKLIDQLKSPDKNKRYYACEDLRLSSELPEGALDALQEAAHDSDRGVAEAARHALALHFQREPADSERATDLAGPAARHGLMM